MSHDRIPKDPVANLERMQSILAGYKRKVAHKKSIREVIQGKLDRLREAMADGDYDGDTEENQEVIERKHLFDLTKLDAEIEQLEGQIIWAEKRQIPFVESEVKRLSEMENNTGEAEATIEE